MILGIDEAGRGPVIGPLVLALASIEEDKESLLTSIGVKDSKKLSRNKREQLFEQLKEILFFFDFKIIYPAEIDLAVNSKSYNLNWLEADATAFLINRFCNRFKDLDYNEITVYLDLPSNNKKSYLTYLRSKLNCNLNIIAEHKADDTYPIVSAASIIAKVIRDREIDLLKEKYGDFGSGYPSDPKTSDFLKKNFDKFDSIFRKSWSSYRRLKDNKQNQKGLSDFFNKSK